MLWLRHLHLRMIKKQRGRCQSATLFCHSTTSDRWSSIACRHADSHPQSPDRWGRRAHLEITSSNSLPHGSSIHDLLLQNSIKCHTSQYTARLGDPKTKISSTEAIFQKLADNDTRSLNVLRSVSRVESRVVILERKAGF